MTKAAELTQLLISLIKEKSEIDINQPFYLALSGGTSPTELFRLWSSDYKSVIQWDRLNLFWVDERAVPPDNPESNYGMAVEQLIKKVPLSNNQIFRIKGESEPEEEAFRYSQLVNSELPVVKGSPLFDLIILGIGDDGHTASIFPGQDHLMNHPHPYATSVNPYSGQKRITMTGKTIINAKNVCFYLRGPSKESMVNRLKRQEYHIKLPADNFLKLFGESSLYYDKF